MVHQAEPEPDRNLLTEKYEVRGPFLASHSICDLCGGRSPPSLNFEFSLGRHRLAMHTYPLLSPPAPRGSSLGLTTGDESGAPSWEAHKSVESS
jgi:hypothetical protein